MFIGFYVQIYSALQDFLSEKIVGRIAHKDIWLLHALPFCVEQDAPLMLLDSFKGIFNSFMYNPFVFSKSPL